MLHRIPHPSPALVAATLAVLASLWPLPASGATARPIIARHANVRAEATSPRGAVVTYKPATVRNATSVKYSKRSGSVFRLGTTVVTITASNRSGISRATFKVVVVDTTAPAFDPMSAVKVGAPAAAGANVSYTIRATDRADPGVSISCSPPSGSLFAVGTTTVGCTARDASGNSAETSFKVVVTPPGVKASGRYAGTTTQNKAITFGVSDDGFQIVDVAVAADFTCSPDDAEITGGGFTIPAPVAIAADGTFAGSGSGPYHGQNFTATYWMTYQGAFTGSGSAKGTFRVHLSLSSPAGYECDTSPMLWTAALTS